jgi:hypothetical protein
VGERLLVAGSRTWTDRAAVVEYLNIASPEVLIVGDCPTGADLFAREWTEGRKIQLIVNHALWQQEGKAAGPLRNERMFKYDKPTLVVCFRMNGMSPGTDDVIRRARMGGIPLEVIREPMPKPVSLRPTK